MRCVVFADMEVDGWTTGGMEKSLLHLGVVRRKAFHQAYIIDRKMDVWMDGSLDGLSLACLCLSVLLWTVIYVCALDGWMDGRLGRDG